MGINFIILAYVDALLLVNCAMATPIKGTYTLRTIYFTAVVVFVVAFSSFIYPCLLFLVVLACQFYCFLVTIETIRLCEI